MDPTDEALLEAFRAGEDDALAKLLERHAPAIHRFGIKMCPQQCAEMDAHVAQCARCRARCDSLRSTLALCNRSAREGTVPPQVQEAVRRALRELA